jgi:hypothetical protein
LSSDLPADLSAEALAKAEASAKAGAPQERRRTVATGIPLRDLHLAWPELWPLLEPAVRRTPDKPDVLARLIARDAQLWAVYDDDKAIAAIVTQITCEPDGKRCRLWLVGGSRMRAWAADFLCKLELWARSLGCVALWGSGREGWDRIVKRMGGSRIGTIAGFPAWERRL